jgi:hypothetical protein
MMKYAIILVGAVALSACGGPETKEEALTSAAKFFNGNAGALSSTQFKDIKVSARVEEDVLIIKMANFPSGTRTFDPNAARKLFRGKICEISKSRDIIEMGGKVRVDIRSNYGKDLPSVQIASC